MNPLSLISSLEFAIEEQDNLKESAFLGSSDFFSFKKNKKTRLGVTKSEPKPNRKVKPVKNLK